eukprot:jgi/Undpi1/12249/HiC_scaffold_5.g01925.m1
MSLDARAKQRNPKAASCGQLLPRRRGRLGAGELVLAGRLKGDGVLGCCLGGGGGEEQLHRRRRRARPSGSFEESVRGTLRGTIRNSVTVAFSTSACSPSTTPVEEGPGASSGISPTPPYRNPARGFPGPSVPAATAAVARGDVENGLDIFLQCMSRRRLKLAAEAASTRGQGNATNGRNMTGKTAGGDGVNSNRNNTNTNTRNTSTNTSTNPSTNSMGDGWRKIVPGQGGVPACNKFLRALGDAGRIDDAVVAYEAMAACELHPTIVTFSTLISRAGACRRVRVAERFYEEMLQAGITPDVQAMNSLINAFSKAGSPDQALKAFDEMSRYGVAPSVITFNSLIDACARAGDIDRARLVFSRLLKSGLTPNDRTFSALIHSHAVDDAFGLLQEMRARGLEPNRVTYSALINACGRAGQLARAFQTLDEMCKSGIEPNVVTWTTLIDACGKGKELEWSFRLFSEMRARGTVPNGVTCSALMDACLKADELDLAFAVLEHMLDIGIEPTEVTYTSLLTQCARLGRSGTAEVAREEWNTDTVGVGGGSWKMDRKLENDLLKLFGQADQVDAAFKVLEGMVARRDSPDSETWLLLLNAVGTADSLDKAVALIERSRAEGDGSEINELTYSALLGACGRAKKLARAFRIVQGMRDTGVQPTESTYLALMEVCRHSRDSKAAVEVFEAMETEGVRPGEGGRGGSVEEEGEGEGKTMNICRRLAAVVFVLPPEDIEAAPSSRAGVT